MGTASFSMIKSKVMLKVFGFKFVSKLCTEKQLKSSANISDVNLKKEHNQISDTHIKHHINFPLQEYGDSKRSFLR